MAYKKPAKVPGKLRITEADIKAATGARVLTSAEARRSGASLRTYTTQKPGVKKLDKSKFLSRRQVTKQTLSVIYGGGKVVTPEKRAAINFAEAGGRSTQTLFQERRRQYAIQKYGKPKIRTTRSGRIVEEFPVKLSSITLKSDKAFARLYRESQSEGRDRVSTIRRLTALYDLTGDEYYKQLLQRYFS